jgi:cell division protein FtsN
MRVLVGLLMISLLMAASCNSTKTSLFGGNRKEKEPGGTSIKTTLAPAGPIRDVEEKLVPVENKAPSPQKYFVVIGSFKDPANARDHQAAVHKKGFVTEILKNDAGLYRVSVMATNDITAARNEVRRIWAKFPEYSDTWMLISK